MIETPFYKITPYSNLLHIENFLSWDERIVIEILAEVESVIDLFYHDKQWALLSDRGAWELATPIAEQLFSQIAPNALNDTLTHIAIVIGKSEIKKWQLKNMTERYHMYKTEFFETPYEAEQWLSSFGYQMKAAAG
jgi:hypothetical protein